MTRASPSDVKEIGELDELSDSKIQSFIDDANTIVNARLDGHIDKTLLQPVEEWLAVHLATMNPKERTTSWETVGQSEIRFEGRGEYGLGLEHSRYGQQVLAMVPSYLLLASKGAHYNTAVHESSEKERTYDPERWG